MPKKRSTMFYLVSYSCEQCGRETNAMMLWAGTKADWILFACLQPEKWTLLNFEPITEDNFKQLDGVVG